MQNLFSVLLAKRKFYNFHDFLIILHSMNHIGKSISETYVSTENFLLIFLKYFSQNVDEKMFPSSYWNTYSTEEEEIFYMYKFSVYVAAASTYLSYKGNKK